MDDFMMWTIPFGFFLCVAAVQGMRKNWQKAVVSLLAAGICFALMADAGQSHANAMLRIRLRHLEIKIAELQLQLDNMNGTSNEASQTIGLEAAPQSGR